MARQVKFENRVISVPDDATDDEVAAIIDSSPSSVQALPPSPAAQKPSLGTQALDVAKGVLELPAQLATSAVALPASGLAGLAAAAGKALGLTDKNPADVVESTQRNLTYQPTSQSAKGAGELIAKPFEGWEQGAQSAGDKTLDVTGSPALAAGVKTAISAAPDVMGALTGVKAARAPKLPGQGLPPAQGPRLPASEVPKPVPATPTERVLAKGYQARPTDVSANEPGRVGAVKKTAERVSDSEQLREGFVEKNQKLTDTEARAELALPASTKVLTPQVFEKARAPHGAVYEKLVQTVGKNVVDDGSYTAALRKASNTEGLSPDDTRTVKKLIRDYGDLSAKDARGVVESIKDLRAAATKDYRNGADSIGSVRKAIADAMEDTLESSATAAGHADLVNEFRAARTALAKLYTVEDATVAGRVDAHKLKKARDRGVKLTGRLADIADAAEYLPNVTQHPHTMGKAARTPLDAVANYATLGLKPLAEAGARKVLGSDKFQGKLAPPTGKSAGAVPGPAEWPASMTPRPPEPQAPSPGNLELAPDRVGQGGMPFTASPNPRAVGMAGDLELAENARLQQSGLADDLELPQFTTRVEAGPPDLVPWDAEASPDGSFAYGRGVPFREAPAQQSYSWPQRMEAGRQPPRTNDLTLADEVIPADLGPGPVPTERAPFTPSAQDVVDVPRSLADELGLRVEPHPTEPDFYVIRSPNGEGVSVKGLDAVEQLLGETLFTDPPATTAPPRQVPKVNSQAYGKRPRGDSNGTP